MATSTKLWAIWECQSKCFRVDRTGEAILVYTSKTTACNRAAQEYGFKTYTEAKKQGWCEVLLFQYEHLSIPARLLK